jgi:hypothetical protein
MFTRSPSAEPALEPRTTRPTAATGPQPSISAPSSGEKSVIGNDLKIIGQGLKIISRGILQVDGEIEGDVQAAEVIANQTDCAQRRPARMVAHLHRAQRGLQAFAND